MPNSRFNRSRLAPIPSTRSAVAFRWTVLGLYFAGCACLLFDAFLPPLALQERFWVHGLIVALALLVTLSWLSRRLPLQNVILGSSIMAVIAAVITILAVQTGVPFGPFKLEELADTQILEGLPWPFLVFWVTALLNCRGVAKLVLRRWRGRPNYGFWVIGLTALLMTCLAGVWDPFATQIGRYWVWHTTRTSLTWFGAPWIMFPGWAVMTMLILAFATPAFINKRQVAQGPDYVPLAIWCSLMLVPGVALAVKGITPPAILCSACLLVFGGLAVWGGEGKR